MHSVKVTFKLNRLVLLTFLLLVLLTLGYMSGGASSAVLILSQDHSTQRTTSTTFPMPPSAHKYLNVQPTSEADYKLSLHKPKNATCDHPPSMSNTIGLIRPVYNADRKVHLRKGHNGVVVYTLGANAADQKAEMLGEIAIALSRLEDQFNKYACYPILLFHTGLSMSEQLKLATYTTAEMKLVDVSAVWHFPAVLTDAVAAGTVMWDEICRCGTMKFPSDYCLMGPWWIYYVFKTGFLKPYDYWWRMDTDTYLISPLPTDPFDLIAQRNFAFSYVQFEPSEMEYEPCISSLYDTAARYAELVGAAEPRKHKMLANRGSRWSGWWAVAETKFFHSEAYFDFMGHLVENWPWNERWGEQAVWPLLFGFFDNLTTSKYPWREYLIHKQDPNPEAVKAQCSQQLAPLCGKFEAW
ncbi:hypothetical protein HKX48_006800 [Thoreauomyces humboldtii]|nr:hypothetical protein HKX48_006800 [Thoreauomyces humboldtii]